jgi:hypothetical protein
MGIDPKKLSMRQWLLVDGDQKPPREEKPPSTSSLERDQQRVFANWINSHGYPRCWHRTDRRTGADPGVFDFWVGRNGHSAWIEFKLHSENPLRPEQEEFRRRLDEQGLEWHVVTTAEEAIGIVKEWK